MGSTLNEYVAGQRRGRKWHDSVKMMGKIKENVCKAQRAYSVASVMAKDRTQMLLIT